MLETGYFRIPGSRPYKLSPKKEKKIREQSWDNRFHLGKIPEYNAIVDIYLQRIPIQKKKVIAGVGRVRRRKDSSKKQLSQCTSSNKIPKQQVVKSHILKKLKENLVFLWEQKSIPYAQREIFLQSIERLTAKKQSAVLVKEMEMLKLDKNFTQLVLRAIKARENSLIELKDFSDTIQSPTSIIKQNSVESLINLRMLSLHVVECIQAWRKNLHEFDVEFVPDNLKFVWEGQNYLIKMFSDTKFLNSSQMSQFINFSTNDPFFVHCSQVSGKIELPLPSYLLKRIKESEKILENEGLVLREVKIKEKIEEKLQISKSRILEQFAGEEVTFESASGNLESEILKYAAEVPALIQNSMGKCGSVLQTALSLRFPAFLWAKLGNFKVGLISLNLDNQKSVQNRILISHISAINLEIFEKIAESILKYIWTQYSCSEIRVGIIAKINELGKYECEAAIKSIFDKQGFRWKQMIYAINEIPVQILGVRRPEPVEAPNFSIFSDSITIAYVCGLQKKETPPTDFHNFCSAVGVACAYRHYNSVPFSIFSEILTKMHGIPPAFRIRKDSTLHSACRDLTTLQLKLSSLEPAKETSVACSALGLSWEKFLPVLYNSRKLTKIEGQIEIMTGHGQVVYILTTEDSAYNVFIIPNESGKVKEGFEAAQEILRKMEKVGVEKEIWVPDFEVKRECFGNGVEERIRFRVATAMHPIGAYFEGPKEGSVVVGERFVFGVVHHKLDEELELPLYVFEVGPNDILKIN